MSCLQIFSAVILATCFLESYSNFAQIGEEVEAGNVLLPATRRGRYLADIIRRQAVDGTGIKFNKDADRLNADAKKQIDALSEELLPYVTSEQERRVALHKRIMLAVQSGEHGVTVAEVRGRPPLFIQRGKYLRCPSNRAALEPDNSGNIMCTQGAKPSQVLYDACLRSEDAPLYVINGSNGTNYFFCNRNRDKKSPELPRNDTHVYSCDPCESTSRDYTVENCAPEQAGDDVIVHYRYYPDRIYSCDPCESTSRDYTVENCAPEQTGDDVIVHYRYYPDRLFTAVRELDPDGEVCDHWNPCQIGYIFSIATIESARPAVGLNWPDDEIVKQEEDAQAASDGAARDEETTPVDGGTAGAEGDGENTAKAEAGKKEGDAGTSTPPEDDTLPPADGETPPADGETPPADGEAPPADGEASPAPDGEAPP